MNCMTHHDACDCREKTNREAREIVMALFPGVLSRTEISVLQQRARVWWVQHKAEFPESVALDAAGGECEYSDSAINDAAALLRRMAGPDYLGFHTQLLQAEQEGRDRERKRIVQLLKKWAKPFFYEPAILEICGRIEGKEKT